MLARKVHKEIEYFLKSDNPAELAEVLDMYVNFTLQSGQLITLPQPHMFMRELIEMCKADDWGYVAFLRELRDSATPGYFDELHRFFRKVQGRYVQKIRRKRLDLAADLIKDQLHVALTYQQRQKIQLWVEQRWTQERAGALHDAKVRGSRKALTADERAEICAQFWDEVDASLELGVVPIPPSEVYVELRQI